MIKKIVGVPKASSGEFIASTSRLEAFSDAVLAIIMTLLVLEIHVPDLSEKNIWSDFQVLWHLFPQIGAFALSFVTLLVIWVNHHHFFHDLRGIDKKLLWHNNHLLFWICMVPFATALVGKNLGTAVATATYGAVMFMMAVSYALMINHAFFKSHTIAEKVTLKVRKMEFKRALFGPAVYLIGIFLSFFHPWVSLGLYVLVMAFYFMPVRLVEETIEAVSVPIGGS